MSKTLKIFDIHDRDAVHFVLNSSQLFGARNILSECRMITFLPRVLQTIALQSDYLQVAFLQPSVLQSFQSLLRMFSFQRTELLPIMSQSTGSSKSRTIALESRTKLPQKVCHPLLDNSAISPNCSFKT